jgi:hypothetical protein
MIDVSIWFVSGAAFGLFLVFVIWLFIERQARRRVTRRRARRIQKEESLHE